jgi:predicted alpha/beta-hydrolase family hydrolase
VYSFDTLQVSGYDKKPLPHTLMKQAGETQHLAVLLPGVGYTTRMPLLYYPMLELLRIGADVMRVETVYVKRPKFDTLSPAEKAHWVSADASAACQAALAQRSYQQITLVGKSLGTLAMGHLLTSESGLDKAQAIWLTPLLWHDPLRAQICQAMPRSLFVAGTADPHNDATLLAEVAAATRGATVVIDGANHSLEIEGDVMASLQAIERTMRAVQVFLADDGLQPSTV